MSSEQIEYHDRINSEFAEAVYQEMASTRYGIDFCCTPNLTKWSIKKELLDLNNLQVNMCDYTSARPGSVYFVPGPCGKIFVETSEQGGSVEYVPCGSYNQIRQSWVGNGGRYLCYDLNAGYTVGGTSPNIMVIEEPGSCDDENIAPCKVTMFSSRKEPGTVIYQDCAGVTHVVALNPSEGKSKHGPVCIQNDQAFSITESIEVGFLGNCTGECLSLSFTLAEENPPVYLSYTDCNNVSHNLTLVATVTQGPMCVKSYSINDDNEVSIVYHGECNANTA